MKKHNFGIPAILLCISAYALATVSLWMVLGLTILAFACNFEPKIKKTTLQASAITIFFMCVNLVFSLFYQFIGSSGYSTTITQLFGNEYSDVNIFNKIIYLFDNLFQAAEVIILAVLIICILIRNDIILQVVSKAVDGFIPPQPQFQQPMQQQPMQQQAMQQQPMHQQAMQQQAMQQPIHQQPMQRSMDQQNQFMQQPNQFVQQPNPSNQFVQSNQFQQPQNPNQVR